MRGPGLGVKADRALILETQTQEEREGAEALQEADLTGRVWSVSRSRMPAKFRFMVVEEAWDAVNEVLRANGIEIECEEVGLR